MYKRHWLISLNTNGFVGKVFVYGTEMETREYIDSEIPGWTGMVGATDNEVAAARTLGLPVYLAPEKAA